MVGWPIVIPNLHPTFVTLVPPGHSISLYHTSWVELGAVVVEVSCWHSRTLSEDYVPTEFMCSSLNGLRPSLIIDVD
jgi:hypothetical protein